MLALLQIWTAEGQRQDWRLVCAEKGARNSLFSLPILVFSYHLNLPLFLFSPKSFVNLPSPPLMLSVVSVSSLKIWISRFPPSFYKTLQSPVPLFNPWINCLPRTIIVPTSLSLHFDFHRQSHPDLIVSTVSTTC